jgi:putative FmdB family regulatory protein
MPFYEYECKACGAHHEAMQKISDPPLKKCPECGKSRLVKLISAPVFRLKGGGWYETDFKSDQETKRNLAGEEKGEKADSTDKGDAKTADSKADAKPEAKADKSESKAVAKPATPAKTAKPAAKASKPAPKRPAAKPAKKGTRRR